nr:hypothetical protein [uncultured Flavobacterium sp.]
MDFVYNHTSSIDNFDQLVPDIITEVVQMESVRILQLAEINLPMVE